MVAHIFFAGDRRLDSKTTISCPGFTGPVYRNLFSEGWRSASDTRACDHCKGAAEVQGESERRLCGKYPVTFIYCPSNSLVISTHEDSYGESLVDFCI